MSKERKLFNALTTGNDSFYVIAESWEKAADAVERLLGDLNRGFSDERKVKRIELIRSEEYYSNRERRLSSEVNYIVFDDPAPDEEKVEKIIHAAYKWVKDNVTDYISTMDGVMVLASESLKNDMKQELTPEVKDILGQNYE